LDVAFVWGPIVRLESNVAPSILTVSESWITESSNLTEERLDGRQFLQVKRPNQQYQSTEEDATKYKENNENN